MLVLPSVSIGNVPQLAVDLLIHTYGFQLVQSLDNDFVVPLIGPLDYVDEPAAGIATAVQLYSLGELFLVQIRAPPCAGARTQFLRQLKSDLGDRGDCVVVCSANAGFRAGTNLTTLEVTETADPDADLPEAGFAGDALRVFNGSRALVAWVYEGDNFSDAKQLASRLVAELGLALRPFTPPVSWARVYGREPPIGLENGIYS